jgi:hypothetical protein
MSFESRLQLAGRVSAAGEVSQNDWPKTLAESMVLLVLRGNEVIRMPDATYNLNGGFKPTMKRFADLSGPDFFPTPRARDPAGHQLQTALG